MNGSVPVDRPVAGPNRIVRPLLRLAEGPVVGPVDVSVAWTVIGPMAEPVDRSVLGPADEPMVESVDEPVIGG